MSVSRTPPEQSPPQSTDPAGHNRVLQFVPRSQPTLRVKPDRRSALVQAQHQMRRALDARQAFDRDRS